MPAPASTVVDRAAGCLLGGALGDALGAPIEFLEPPEIRRRYGPSGIAEPPRPALISDDTQLTLFTAEGYLRAWIRGRDRGRWGPSGSVWTSYRRWLKTQQFQAPDGKATGLLTDARFYASRAPALSCLRALAGGEAGSRANPINDAKGSGGITRTAPAGFATSAETAYRLGADFAALTHGNPGGWAPAAAFALIIHLVGVRNRPLQEAIDQAVGRVLRDDQETAQALIAAIRSAEEDREAGDRAREAKIFGRPVQPGGPSAHTVAQLGSGWTGPEALSIGVYAALAHPKAAQFPEALRIAANHAGDSDNTAAIAGSILGAVHGTAALPRDWLARLELADLIERVGRDLGASCIGRPFHEDIYEV